MNFTTLNFGFIVVAAWIGLTIFLMGILAGWHSRAYREFHQKFEQWKDGNKASIETLERLQAMKRYGPFTDAPPPNVEAKDKIE